MAKTRKTKKEKQRSAMRAKMPLQNTSSDIPPVQNTSVFTFVSDSPTRDVRPTTLTVAVSHLVEDLQRTSVVIGAILLAEVLLYFILTMR